MTDLSTDALAFGLAYLPHSRAELSFGGDHAVMEITPRARAALMELVAAGYARETMADPLGRHVNGEAYRGTDKQPHLGQIVKNRGLDPFGDWTRFQTFMRKSGVVRWLEDGTW